MYLPFSVETLLLFNIIYTPFFHFIHFSPLFLGLNTKIFEKRFQIFKSVNRSQRLFNFIFTKCICICFIFYYKQNQHYKEYIEEGNKHVCPNRCLGYAYISNIDTDRVHQQNSGRTIHARTGRSHTVSSDCKCENSIKGRNMHKGPLHLLQLQRRGKNWLFKQEQRNQPDKPADKMH